MIKFTQTRVDLDSFKFGQRMLRAGNDGYKSQYHDLNFDDYILISTATEKQLKGNYTEEDLVNIFQELENVSNEETVEFTVSSGEVVLLYWEIDRFSK